MRHLLACLCLFGLVFVVSGCGDDDIGGACRDTGDCADGFCARGGDFPDGLCTYACNDDGDCPGGWSCIDKQGGLCLPNCSSNGECSEADNRWTCKSEDRRGGSGKASVCIGK